MVIELGKSNISITQQQRRATVDPIQAAAAGQSFGESISNFGRALQQNQDAIDLSTIQANTLDAITLLNDELDRDPDFRTRQERGQKGMAEIRDKALQSAPSEQVKLQTEQFLLQQETNFNSANTQKTFSLQRDSQRADLQTNMDMLQKQITNLPRFSPERIQAEELLITAIGNAKIGGSISAQEEQVFTEQRFAAIQKADLQNFIATDPDGYLLEFTKNKAGLAAEFDFLTDADLRALSNDAVRQGKQNDERDKADKIEKDNRTLGLIQNNMLTDPNYTLSDLNEDAAKGELEDHRVRSLRKQHADAIRAGTIGNEEMFDDIALAIQVDPFDPSVSNDMILGSIGQGAASEFGPVETGLTTDMARRLIATAEGLRASRGGPTDFTKSNEYKFNLKQLELITTGFNGGLLNGKVKNSGEVAAAIALYKDLQDPKFQGNQVLNKDGKIIAVNTISAREALEEALVAFPNLKLKISHLPKPQFTSDKRDPGNPNKKILTWKQKARAAWVNGDISDAEMAAERAKHAEVDRFEFIFARRAARKARLKREKENR